MNLQLHTLALAATLLAGGAQAAPSVYPTGVTRYDPAKAWNGYVLFGAADEKTYLIDANGNEIRRWEHVGSPSGLIDPAVNGGRRGHVLVRLEKRKELDPRGFGNGLNTHAIGELDWNGKPVWTWGEQAPGGSAFQHHDWQRLANGNTLLLANKLHKIAGFKLDQTIDDAIYEVDPEAGWSGSGWPPSTWRNSASPRSNWNGCAIPTRPTTCTSTTSSSSGRTSGTSRAMRASTRTT